MDGFGLEMDVEKGELGKIAATGLREKRWWWLKTKVAAARKWTSTGWT